MYMAIKLVLDELLSGDKSTNLLETSQRAVSLVGFILFMERCELGPVSYMKCFYSFLDVVSDQYGDIPPLLLLLLRYPSPCLMT